jgi:hypothetical protein
VTADDTTPKQVPTPAEVGHARAYLAGVAHGFGLLWEDWTGIGDGTATTTDSEGTTLRYTGDELHPFDAVIPCRRHGRHRVGVTRPAQLDRARADTAACSSKAPAPAPAPAPPAVTLRAVTKPSPLWLITRAAETPGEDRHRPAS